MDKLQIIVYSVHTKLTLKELLCHTKSLVTSLAATSRGQKVIMPDMETQIKNLEAKYKELLRAFKSLNTKVNNNHERYSERFTDVENSVKLQESTLKEIINNKT